MIESGIVDRNYVMKLLPKIFNARWITTAIRILRLYMQTENPCDELVVMVNFIMKAYGPCLFSIHLKPEVWHAPNHFYQYLKRSEEALSAQHFDHIFKCVTTLYLMILFVYFMDIVFPLFNSKP